MFAKKNKISINSMSRLIEENSGRTLDNVINILAQMNTSFDTIESKLNILSINYELCRYELYKSNDKIDVNDLMDDLYSRIYYNLNINSNNNYSKIVDDIISKSKEIFNVRKLMAPAERFAYRLLLEQLNIKENSVSKELIQDLLFYAKIWVNNAQTINKTYCINVDDNNESEKIDFKF